MSDPIRRLDRVESHGIQIARVLYDFVNHEALPGTGVVQERFWGGLATLIQDLSPRNAQLLQRRDQLQEQIDAWHHAHPGPDFDAELYRRMLEDIGYLQSEGDSFTIDVHKVDAEIAHIAGPQLVVPLDNARYAIHAANARWGSLYDALYGTDAISEENGAGRTKGYNPVRGAKVIAFARDFLDQHFPLLGCSHRDVASYTVSMRGLSVRLQDGRSAALQDPSEFVGFQGDAESPGAILLVHHKLHVEIQFDRDQSLSRNDAAGVSDIVLESAITTIQDCEDSVAAVDAGDKVHIYRNWLGLMKGTLETSFYKDGKILQRTLNPDRRYQTAAGDEVELPGRSLLLVRNVGHFMMTDAITLGDLPVPEAFIDAAATALIAKHDLLRSGPLCNSRQGSIYIVKPKMHGAEEVAFADELFEQIENLLALPRHTIKIGIMDEERRTTLNLKECIRAARRRVVFINTGFLDRTGSEIHTSMEAGPMMRKNELRKAAWLAAYERHNVDIGLLCGLPGNAQIGKGMWAMPDQMAAMLASKIAHPLAGANTSWVPSPTAATLHALHYHQINVAQVQAELVNRPRTTLEDILRPPLAARDSWNTAEVAEEIDNNVQSILGYVVRWIDFGIGCSKVPDYYDTALMEDRATLRISSQHLANWLRHGVCTAEQIEQAFRRMAAVVDKQNAGDPSYQPMSANIDHNIALAAARDLVFKGREQPDGYTETILHLRRTQRKAMLPPTRKT
jgi:malate synthase